MLTPGFLGFIAEMALGTRIGIWVILLMTAFYIWRLLNVSSKMSDWLVKIAVSLVIIATGLASGIITGVDVDRAFAIVGMIVDVVFDIVFGVLL